MKCLKPEDKIKIAKTIYGKTIKKLSKSEEEKQIISSKRNFRVYKEIAIIEMKYVENKKTKKLEYKPVNVVKGENALKIQVNNLNKNFIKKISKRMIKEVKRFDKDRIENYKNKIQINGKDVSKLPGDDWYVKDNKDSQLDVAGIVINQLDMASKLINTEVRKKTTSGKYKGKNSTKRIKTALELSIQKTGINICKDLLEKYILTNEEINFENKYLESIYKIYLCYLITYKYMKKYVKNKYNDELTEEEKDINVNSDFKDFFEYLVENLNRKDLWDEN